MEPAMMTRRQVLSIGASAAFACSGRAAAQSVEPKRKVLWAANVRSKPFGERVEAARVGGFTHMSVFPIDWRKWTTQDGLTRETMRAQLKEAGIKVLAIDPFVQWVPGFKIPEGYPADYVGFIDFSADNILRIADDLEAEAINCVEGLNQPHEQASLVDALGAFADRAKENGLRITFEFMPISSVPDLSAGWALVNDVNRDNAGLCFDTWHYYRSTPNPELLAQVPGSKIFEVQLADAMRKLQAETLTEDLLRFRKIPGEGELDIAGVSRILKKIGAWNSVGPEVFADAMDKLAATEVGEKCGLALTKFNSMA
jgi:sugar phosphate isomerase/epimerase